MSDTTTKESTATPAPLLVWEPMTHGLREQAFLSQARDITIAVLKFDGPTGKWTLLSAFAKDSDDGVGRFHDPDIAKKYAEVLFREWVVRVWPVLVAVGGKDLESELSAQREKLSICGGAIQHILEAISVSCEKFWLMGFGTESYRQLTEAMARINGKSVEVIRAQYCPKESDYTEYCAQRNRDDQLLDYCRDAGITVPKE